MARKTGATELLSKKGLRMYMDGMTDVEIAVVVGCVRSNVCRWRKQLGLEANAPTGSEDWYACMKNIMRTGEETIGLYDKGLTDAEVAKRLGITKSAARKRRRRFKFPPNRKSHEIATKQANQEQECFHPHYEDEEEDDRA